jgi:hypothetical protein
MAIKTLVLLVVFVFPSHAVFASECLLGGAKVAKFAYQKGFRFNSSNGSNASCRISSHKAGGSAASNKGGTCTLDLFAYKNLSSPWVFRSFRYSGNSFKVIESPKSGEKSIQIKAELTPGKNGTATFLLSKISIEGGDCDDWKDAF